MYLIKNKLTGKEHIVKLFAYYIDPKKNEGCILNGQQVIASYTNVNSAIGLEYALMRDFTIAMLEDKASEPVRTEPIPTEENPDNSQQVLS
jgi:hypothetical protein